MLPVILPLPAWTVASSTFTSGLVFLVGFVDFVPAGFFLRLAVLSLGCLLVDLDDLALESALESAFVFFSPSLTFPPCLPRATGLTGELSGVSCLPSNSSSNCIAFLSGLGGVYLLATVLYLLMAALVESVTSTPRSLAS